MKSITIYGRPPSLHIDDDYTLSYLLTTVAQQSSSPLVILDQPITKDKADIRAHLHKIRTLLLGGSTIAGIFVATHTHLSEHTDTYKILQSHLKRVITELQRLPQSLPQPLYTIQRDVNDRYRATTLIHPDSTTTTTIEPTPPISRVEFVRKLPPTIFAVHPVTNFRLLLHGAKSSLEQFTVNKAHVLLAKLLEPQVDHYKEVHAQILNHSDLVAKPNCYRNVPNTNTFDTLMLRNRKDRRLLMNLQASFVLHPTSAQGPDGDIQNTWWSDLGDVTGDQTGVKDDTEDTITLDFNVKYTAAALCFPDDSISFALTKLSSDRVRTLAYRLTSCCKQLSKSGILRVTQPSGVVRVSGGSRHFVSGASAGLEKVYIGVWDAQTNPSPSNKDAQVGHYLTEDTFKPLSAEYMAQAQTENEVKKAEERVTERQTKEKERQAEMDKGKRRLKLTIALFLLSVSISSLLLQSSMGNVQSPFLTWMKSQLFSQPPLI